MKENSRSIAFSLEQVSEGQKADELSANVPEC